MKLDSKDTSASAAQDQAQKHCESWAKNAVPAQGPADGTGIVSYHCR
ncbi:MAG: hypothetical protein JO038_01340 [Alphaproteobacteria bacterium]|nr:hypothetical protein [Alphaproteobacteria bacterium]